MRVLAVAPMVPAPPDHGWRVRTYHLLRNLRPAAEVAVLTWRLPETTDDDVAAVAGMVDGLRVLPSTPPAMTAAARYRRWARFLLGGHPPHVQAQLEERGATTQRGRAAIAQAVRELENGRPFDVVVAEEETVSMLPVRSGRAPLAVHRLEVFGPAMWQALGRSAAGRVRFAVEGRAWSRFDRRVHRRSDIVVATSTETASLVGRLRPARPLLVVPNGTELRHLRTPVRAARDLAYIGSMETGQNASAVTWFARSVWPALRRQFPEATYRIVGRDPRPEVRALAEIEGVVVTGAVADVAEACEGVRLGVVSLREGMGIKNKTLDFMSMGIPVVTLRPGVEGVGARRDDGVVLVEDEAAFGDVIAELLADDDQIEALGRAAQAYVARHHAWPSIAADYAEGLRSLLPR